MQKKIIALAVAGLSTAAFAQTNVTIYGVADVSAQGTNVSSHVATVSNNITGGVFTLKSNSSLIGFKGTEDLGNGLKGLFQMENQVNLTGTDSATNNSAAGPQAGAKTNMFGAMRDSYVGVNSKYGTVLGGYLSTPYRSALNSFDVMPGATGDGRIESIMGTMQYANATGSASTGYTAGAALKSSIRATALAYALPTLYGFNGSIAYTGSTNNLNNQYYGNGNSLNLRSGLSFNLGWDGYGIGIKGAFQQFGYDNTQSTSTTASVQGYTSYLIGAQYTGVPGLKIATVYGRNTLGTNQNSVSGGSNKGSNNQIWVGASYRFGNNEPRLSYANTSNVSGLNNPNAASTVYATQTGAKQWTANWGYYLSKRTQVYGIVSAISNNANGTYNMASGGTNITLSGGQNVVTYGMGMRTNF